MTVKGYRVASQMLHVACCTLHVGRVASYVAHASLIKGELHTTRYTLHAYVAVCVVGDAACLLHLQRSEPDAMRIVG